MKRTQLFSEVNKSLEYFYYQNPKKLVLSSIITDVRKKLRKLSSGERCNGIKLVRFLIIIVFTKDNDLFNIFNKFLINFNNLLIIIMCDQSRFENH